ncbi:movement protein [Sesamum angolense]|uniref:Movement protein n=1 Tax=Sesamum angolense TaxID=2727404 RepID=A0AAE1X100_9LAMI|nr:movement protein [Sesamum angolense]
MRQDSNLSPYDGFRIGGIGKVLNQIGLNQRKHHIIYKVSSGEFAIPMEFTGNVMEMQLIPKEEILEELRKLMFDIHPRIAYNLADQDFSRVLTLHQDFKRKDLMKEGNRPYSITYRIAYALSNTHHSDLFLRKEYIEIPRIFKEFAKVMAPDPIRIPRIGGVDIIIKDHPVLDRTMSSRIEYGSRMSFSEDRITGYKGKEKDLARVLTPQEIRQPVVGRYEGMLEIAGHEFLVVGVAGRENGCILGNRDLSRRIVYEESEEELKNLKEVIQELKTLDISEESILSLENVKRLIQRNFSENPLAWWDRNKIEATLKIKEECKYEYVRYKPIQMNMEDKKDMQTIIKEHISLGLIEPGISAYSSPGFLVRNHGEIKRGKPRKDFRPLLKEIESAKWKWEEIHTQRVRELKQVCNNLPKLAIPQDKDELVVYTDANDYRWAAVLMKKTTTGEEPCRYTGGLFTEQQAQVWHINEKEFFAVWKAFKKWPLFLLAKEFTLKVDNTNVKAFLKNKLESKIEKAQMEGAEANSVMLRLRHLRENLEELEREFGRLAVNAQVAGQVQRADLDKVQTNIRSSLVASTVLWNALQEPIRKASPSVMTRELREQGSKPALRVQGSRPVAADSSTACTRPSSDSGETATDESQGAKTSDDSSQPSTSGVKEGEISLRPMTGTSKTNTNELSSSSSSAWQVYQRMWEKLISRKGVNPSKTIIETTGKYNRVWMMEGSKPEEVREWYEFGALASVHTMSPSFPEISKLPEWISGREIWVAFNRIKATTEEAPLVSAISEDDISTRRAWGLWVCLTEMDKVKYPFKIFSNKVNGSFLLNSMTGKSTEFAKSMFEKKRMLIWENKLPATESTRMKACNMLHVGQWHNHVCPCCEKQEKPLFGTKIRVTQKKPEPNPDKGTCEPSAAVVWLEEVRKTEDLGYPEARRSNQGMTLRKLDNNTEACWAKLGHVYGLFYVFL